MADKIKVEDNRSWFKKASDAINPVYYVSEAVNPRETQSSARERATGGDPKKAEHFNEEHYKFAKSADVELSHNGSFSKGLAMGFVDGLTGGQFATDPDFRKFHRDVATIQINGGSHDEYKKMQEAAGDPKKSVSDGAPKQQTKVTVHDYAEFTKIASKALPEQRDDISRFAIKNLSSGHNLKDINEAVDAGYETKKQTSLNEKTNNNDTNKDLDKALAQVDTSKLQMSHDNTTQGVPQGDPNIGRTSPAQGTSSPTLTA